MTGEEKITQITRWLPFVNTVLLGLISFFAYRYFESAKSVNEEIKIQIDNAKTEIIDPVRAEIISPLKNSAATVESLINSIKPRSLLGS